jgi:predicted NBD/HSP70 family sugar kinase
MRSDRPQHRAVPVLEMGGSHVTTAAVDLTSGELVPGSRYRAGLDPHADTGTLLGTVAATANRLGAAHTGLAGDRLGAERIGLAGGAVWGMAVPGPFEYDTGVARYHGVGKFTALDGVDVGAELAGRIVPAPAGIRFLNDASAFALGAWWQAPPATRDRRLAAITLGTGIGSAFLAAGTVVEDGPLVPPSGRVDLLTIDGRPLEDTVSTRALTARYAELTGTRLGGVRELAARADTEPAARDVVTAAMRKLGAAIAPWLAAFGADLVVFGGSVTAAWSLIGPPLRAGLADHDPHLAAHLDLTVNTDSENTALLGAAVHATRLA